MYDENDALIYLRADPLKGLEVFREAIRSLNVAFDIISVSSVYKAEVKNKYNELILVLNVQCRFSVEQAQDYVSQINKKAKLHNVHAELLTFNQDIQMSPNLTLPSPLLFDSAVVLNCAAEVCGQYTHPILNKTLVELLNDQHKESDENVRYEFYAQGNSLLDY